jgi:hypothetical protein
MKAILEFDLDDADDRMAHLRCIKSTGMALVLWDLYMNGRKQLGRELNAEPDADPIDLMFNKMNELIEEHNIDLNELIK